MKRIEVVQYDAFTHCVGKGNPAGIIFNGDTLLENEMQQVAKQVGFNECVFICSSTQADMRLRYFTPGHEMNLCGHGTVAAICAWMEHKGEKECMDVNVETLAGIIEVHYDPNTKEVMMTQADVIFQSFTGNRRKLIESIGLDEEVIDERYPIVYGSTGTWTVIIPIKKLSSFNQMKPRNEVFHEILEEIPHASIHPITLETIHKEAHMHGRHFSSSYSGTVEDPVTGTASAVMGAYYLEYMNQVNQVELYIEQGQEIGKDGIVHVWANKVNHAIQVRLAGAAVYVQKKEVYI